MTIQTVIDESRLAPKQMRHWAEKLGLYLVNSRDRRWRQYPIFESAKPYHIRGCRDRTRVFRVLPHLDRMDINDGFMDRWANSMAASVVMPKTEVQFKAAVTSLIRKAVKRVKETIPDPSAEPQGQYDIWGYQHKDKWKMTSAAAIEGVSANGLRWRFEIRLQSDINALMRLGEQVATSDDLPKLDAAWLRITRAVRLFRDDCLDAAVVLALNEQIEDMEQVRAADVERVFNSDPDAWMDSRRDDLSALYDVFDYHRVVVL